MRATSTNSRWRRILPTLRPWTRISSDCAVRGRRKARNRTGGRRGLPERIPHRRRDGGRCTGLRVRSIQAVSLLKRWFPSLLCHLGCHVEAVTTALGAERVSSGKAPDSWARRKTQCDATSYDSRAVSGTEPAQLARDQKDRDVGGKRPPKGRTVEDSAQVHDNQADEQGSDQRWPMALPPFGGVHTPSVPLAGGCS